MSREPLTEYSYCSHIGEEISRLVFEAGVQISLIILENDYVVVHTQWPIDTGVEMLANKFYLDSFRMDTDDDFKISMKVIANMIIKRSKPWNWMEDTDD